MQVSRFDGRTIPRVKIIATRIERTLEKKSNCIIFYNRGVSIVQVRSSSFLDIHLFALSLFKLFDHPNYRIIRRLLHNRSK